MRRLFTVTPFPQNGPCQFPGKPLKHLERPLKIVYVSTVLQAIGRGAPTMHHVYRRITKHSQLWIAIALLVAVAMMSGCQPVQPVEAQTAPTPAGQVLASHEDCKAEGSWIGINTGPADANIPKLIFQETFTPADPSGQNLVAVLSWENPDPTFFGFNTDVDVLSDLTGIAMRTSNDSYDIQLMAYGIETQPEARGEIRYIVTVEGEMNLSDNCNRKVLESATVRLYDKDTADQDEDGFPDEDAEPGRVSGPLQLSDAKRIH